MNLIELDNRILEIIDALQFTADDVAKNTLLDELAGLQLLSESEGTMN